MRRDLLSASLLSIAAASWAMEPGPAAPVIKPTIVAGEQSIALDTADLTQVAKARFFVSADQGRTWTLAQETPVDPANPKPPVFAFRPTADGAYYIVTGTVAKNGTAEAAPAAGSIPGKALLLVVDSTPPVVSTLDAVAEPVTDPRATSATVNITWAITDANFASASLELSVDGGASFTPTQAIAATGSAKLTVALTKDHTAQLRIVAKDAAGNQAPSLAKTIALPVPPDPEKALDAAVKSLPTLADVQPPPDVVKPVEAAAVPGEAKAADGAAPAASGKPVDGASAEPAKATPPAPVATAPTTTTRATSAPTGGAFLSGAAADAELDKARDLRDALNTDEAHAIYLRLQDSSVAKTAAAEDVVMLGAAGDHAAVAGIVDNLRPELRTDTVRLQHGKSLLALGRPADAEQTLLKVRKGSDEAREALLNLGKAAFAQGKNAISTRIYEKLATGNDAVAAEAKLLRGK